MNDVYSYKLNALDSEYKLIVGFKNDILEFVIVEHNDFRIEYEFDLEDYIDNWECYEALWIKTCLNDFPDYCKQFYICEMEQINGFFDWISYVTNNSSTD